MSNKDSILAQKKLQMLETIKNYECGFITFYECIAQIFSIDWNEFEQSLITQTFDKTVKFDTQAFRMFLGLIKEENING